MIKSLPSFLAISVLLSGCTTSIYTPVWPESESGAPVVVEDRGANVPVITSGDEEDQVPVITPQEVGRQAEEKPQSHAVVALLDQADVLQQRGDLDNAVAHVERALRIEPRNPQAYLRLATLRFKQNKVSQAEQLALKGLGYPASANLQAGLWELIANCRESLGNDVGAKEAQLKAKELRSGWFS